MQRLNNVCHARIQSGQFCKNRQITRESRAGGDPYHRFGRGQDGGALSAKMTVNTGFV
ncbi:MAG: hypothetical protein Rhims3KO_28500 [Hyphomicrobiales bacterium]